MILIIIAMTVIIVEEFANVSPLQCNEARLTYYNITIYVKPCITPSEVLLPSVSFRQNRATTYSGGILGRTLPLSVSADDAWLPDEELTW